MLCRQFLIHITSSLANKCQNNEQAWKETTTSKLEHSVLEFSYKFKPQNNQTTGTKPSYLRLQPIAPFLCFKKCFLKRRSYHSYLSTSSLSNKGQIRSLTQNRTCQPINKTEATKQKQSIMTPNHQLKP